MSYIHDKGPRAKQAFEAARFTTSSGFARCNCPFCDEVFGKSDRKACFAVNVNTGFFKCWRCGTKGRLPGFADDMGDRPTKSILEIPQAAGVPAPEGFYAFADYPDSPALDDARNYLRGRGLVDERIWRVANLGACVTGRHAGRVIIPVLSEDDVWLGWVGRAWVKKAEKPYFNAPGMNLGVAGQLYNHAALAADDPSPLIIVEGVLDALALWPNAVAVLGKPTEAQMRSLLGSKRPLVTILDGDAWTQASAFTLDLRFNGARAGYVRLPPRTDPDECDRARLMDLAVQSLSAEDGVIYDPTKT